MSSGYTYLGASRLGKYVTSCLINIGCRPPYLTAYNYLRIIILYVKVHTENTHQCSNNKACSGMYSKQKTMHWVGLYTKSKSVTPN